MEMNEQNDIPENDETIVDIAGSMSARERDEQDSGDAENANDIEIIATLEQENAALKDRVLRAAADMENLRKRTLREVSDARTYAIADFARDMLSATDNLERALLTMPSELRQVSDPAVKSLIEGIEMTEREMQRLMQKNGVKPIMSEGEKFDPHKHQAMFEVPNDSVPAGIVVQVVQTGFQLGERVLRPAMVGISKGGPKQDRSEVNDNATPFDISVPQDPLREDDEDVSPTDTGHIDRQV